MSWPGTSGASLAFMFLNNVPDSARAAAAANNAGRGDASEWSHADLQKMFAFKNNQRNQQSIKQTLHKQKYAQ
jgi:hypothetical protein